MHPLQMTEPEPLPPGASTRICSGQNLAPKAEFRRNTSGDTFDTNDDDDDESSLVGTEMLLDVSEQDGYRSRRNSLPAMRASAEFANLHDFSISEPAGTAGDDTANNNSACSDKEQERKWWWQKPSAVEVDETARATVLHDDSDNCAGARHGEDGEETTRDAEVISRRLSLDHQPIARRASIGGMFGGGWMQQQSQQSHQEEEPQVDAEQAWANATWDNGSKRRQSADDVLDKAAEQLDQQPQQQQQSKPRARRATMSFGIMNTTETLTQQDSFHESQAHAQTNRRPSLGFGPTGLFRGISGAMAPESTAPTAEQLEQERLAKELQDRNLSDMLAMLKAQRNSGRTGPANKTCTNVANAIIVKEYMEIQRRASVSFTDADNSSSVKTGNGVNSSDANTGIGDDRKQPTPKRGSMGFTFLGGFGRNNQDLNEEKAQQSMSSYEDSFSNMTELKPVRQAPLMRASSLRQVTARSSLLPGNEDGASAVIPIRPPIAARRSSIF
mmetsp:Transcript_17330/g.49630  ORF Transcript_17330/g.49630 Transcript_17330/m.49630 type:complete len:500 (+) Transcript_17330:186-1685(+)